MPNKQYQKSSIHELDITMTIVRENDFRISDSSTILISDQNKDDKKQRTL